MTYDNQSQELNLEELKNVSGSWCGNDIKFRLPKFPFPFPFPFPGPGPTFPGPGPTFPDMPQDRIDLRSIRDIKVNTVAARLVRNY